MTKTNGVVRAAGGVVWRQGADGIEVLLVFRNRYGDWSLPKGKLESGEAHKAAALREVHEETGVRCDLGPKLATTVHETPLGEKRVKWWAMQPADGDGDTTGPQDPEEISGIEWLPFDQAWRRVTYGTDRDLLAMLVERVFGYQAN